LGTGTLTMGDQTVLKAFNSHTLSNPISIPAANTNGIIDGTYNITLTGNLTGSGGLIKNGTNTLTLNNPTTRSLGGGLTINNGTLAIATGLSGGLTIGGNLAVGATSGQTATLTVNGGSLIQNNATSIIIGSTGSGSATLNVGNSTNGTLTTGS